MGAGGLPVSPIHKCGFAGDVPGGSIAPSCDQVDGEGMVKVPFVLLGTGCGCGCDSGCSGLGGCCHVLGSFCAGSGTVEGRSGTSAVFVGAAVSFGVSVSSLASLNGEGEGPAKFSKKAESRKLAPI
jgi:hypothetical protein